MSTFIFSLDSTCATDRYYLSVVRIKSVIIDNRSSSADQLENLNLMILQNFVQETKQVEDGSKHIKKELG